MAFSISETSNEQKALKFYELKDIICELLKYVLYYGASIYYGGELNYSMDKDFNILKTMIDVLGVYKKINENGEDIRIYNYLTYPESENITINDKAKYKEDFS
jgi:hypothetical protein